MALGIAAAVAAAATVASTAYKMSQGAPDAAETTTKLEFPEETRALFGTLEKPLIKGLQADQQSTIGPFLGTDRYSNWGVDATYGQAPAVAERAAKKAAPAMGVSDLGPAFESVRGLQPEFVQALRELTLARGQQVNSVVPPGYGQFLSPATHSQTTQPGPSAFDTGFQAAGSLANIAAAYYGVGG